MANQKVTNEIRNDIIKALMDMEVADSDEEKRQVQGRIELAPPTAQWHIGYDTAHSQ